MIRKLSLFLFLVLLIAPLNSIGNEVETRGRNRKIVIWRENIKQDLRDDVLNRHQVRREKDILLINGSVVMVTDDLAEKELRENPNILRVEDDVKVTIANHRSQTIQPSQELPWGIDRVDAEKVWPTGNSGSGIRIAVIDTGISNSHPELLVRRGINTINPFKSWNDDNGHGSHVAGIIAAINNSLGVVGVAPSASLYAVKSLDRNGSGWLSDIIEGIQWSINNQMEIINLSLSTKSNILTFSDAIRAAQNAGIIVVAAAGNNGDVVNYPAAYPEVIAVSATDSNNNLASFSSRGPEVDLATPGVNIKSTYKDSNYAIMSGTSMATPHVVGAAALVLLSPVNSYDINGNGRWDPTEVQQKLQDRTTDLGGSGFDNLYGWGLVNAHLATQ